MQNNASRQQYAQSLAKRYEAMRAKGESIYLDVGDFDRLIEYYLMENDNDTAAELIDLALSIHPRNEFILLKRVAWLLQTERPQEALALVEQLPQNEDTELMLASVYLALGRKKEALQLFRRNLEMSKGDQSLYCSDVADVLMHYEFYADALAFIKQGLQHNPKDEELYQQAIDVSYLMGDLNGCVDYFRRLLDEYPYDAQSWARLGSLYLNMNQLEEAVNALEFANAAASKPELTVCVELGHAYGRLLQYDSAIDAYQQAYDLMEEPHASSLGKGDLAGCLAECYEHKNELDLALSWYYKALEHNPQDDMACVGIAFCLSQQKDYSQAMSYYEKALALNPANKEIWLGIAELLVTIEQYDAAIVAYKQALEGVEDPNLEVLFALANLHFQVGEYQSALEIFLLIKDKNLPMPNLHLCLALCYAMLDQEADAEYYLKLAISDDAKAKQVYEEILKEARQ
ncbi:MAG: tetratricopeptide repeat protein [Bacteroidales bacterium]|nr:tetratricopeptide repeat protein [Bacteroidales bacterium]